MRWLPALVLVTACNQAFRLDPTELADQDADQDGILDADDNCPTVSNQDQNNADGDAFGDACDACVRPNRTNHDEDDDGTVDDCDLCPGIGEFGVDSDSDGIGDVCDGLPTPSSRRYFDPFVSIELPFDATADWQVIGGEAVSPRTALPADDLGLQAPSLVLASNGFAFDLSIESNVIWQSGFTVGFHDAGTNNLNFACRVVCATVGTCELSVFAAGTAGNPQTFAPNPQMRLHVAVFFGSLEQIGCTLFREDGKFVQSNRSLPLPSTHQLWPAIAVEPTMRVTWLDVLESQN
jgi:hypothetical protein